MRPPGCPHPTPRPHRPAHTAPPRRRPVYKARMARPSAERGGSAGAAGVAGPRTKRRSRRTPAASHFSLRHSSPAAPTPTAPGVRGPAAERGTALGAFPGLARRIPAGISGLARAMRSEERRGAVFVPGAVGAPGGGVRSPPPPPRSGWGCWQLGTPAARSRHLCGA